MFWLKAERENWKQSKTGFHIIPKAFWTILLWSKSKDFNEEDKSELGILPRKALQLVKYFVKRNPCESSSGLICSEKLIIPASEER